MKTSELPHELPSLALLVEFPDAWKIRTHFKSTHGKLVLLKWNSISCKYILEKTIAVSIQSLTSALFQILDSSLRFSIWVQSSETTAHSLINLQTAICSKSNSYRNMWKPYRNFSLLFQQTLSNPLGTFLTVMLPIIVSSFYVFHCSRNNIHNCM